MNYRTAAVIPQQEIDVGQIWYVPNSDVVIKIDSIEENEVYYFFSLTIAGNVFGSIAFHLPLETFKEVYVRRD